MEFKPLAQDPTANKLLMWDLHYGYYDTKTYVLSFISHIYSLCSYSCNLGILFTWKALTVEYFSLRVI